MGPSSPRHVEPGGLIRAAVELASDVEGLRLVLASALGERYLVSLADDGGTVGLWMMGGRKR